jgi:hypothetical protein
VRESGAGDGLRTLERQVENISGISVYHSLHDTE